MTALSVEQEKQALQIFERAWALPASEREHFIDEVCGDRADLKRYVWSLMKAPVEQGFLDTAAPIGEHGPVVPKEWNGRTLGAYQIEKGIARGGMGDVYLAKRSDGAFDKEVAIKFIRRDLDLNIERRFAEERQILARLQHPNIAQLLDGGTTDEGVAYYVMEYIEGQTIDQFCKARQLSVTRCLELIIKVCDALAVAHSQLIIHRDIKPDNILVNDDGKPTLLDFGIAKAFYSNDNVDHKTTINPLTPRYASPEQLRHDNLGPASDVYSLAVVLYELLTGTSPYGDAISSPYVLSQKVLDQKPTKPSVLLRQKQKHNTLSGFINFFVSQRALGFGADLDVILLKALAKSPAERYPTVSAFKQDLQSYLQGRAISARPLSWLYQSRKYFLRHKLSTFAACVMVLLAGIALTNHYRNLTKIEQAYSLLTEQQAQIQQQQQAVEQQAQELRQQELRLEEEQARIAVIQQQIQNKDARIAEQQQRQTLTEEQLTSIDKENNSLKEQVQLLGENADRRLQRLYVSTQDYLQLLNQRYWPNRDEAFTTLQQQQRDVERLFAKDLSKKSDLLLQLSILYSYLGWFGESSDINNAVILNSNFITPTLRLKALQLEANNQAIIGQLERSNKLITHGLEMEREASGASAVHYAQLLLRQFTNQLEQHDFSSAQQTLQALEQQRNKQRNDSWFGIAVHFAQGQLFQARNNIIQAQFHFQTALDNSLATANDLKTIEQTYQQIGLYLAMANLQARVGQTEKAQTQLSKATLLLQQKIAWQTYQNAAIAEVEAKVLRQQRRFPELPVKLRSVATIYQRVFSNDHPKTRNAWLAHSQFVLLLGDDELSLRSINNVFSNMTTEPQPQHYYQRGEIYYAQERYLAAKDDFRLAYSLDSKPRYAIGLARTHIRLGDLQQADEILTELEAVAASRWDLLQARALYWELSGEFELATEFYTQADQQLDPQLPEFEIARADIQLGLGKNWFYRNRESLANRHLKRALTSYRELFSDNHPRVVTTLFYLSAVEASNDRSGQFRKARNYFNQALGAEGWLPELAEVASDCYFKMAQVFEPNHSYLVDYWFYQTNLFEAYANSPKTFDENLVPFNTNYASSNKANRDAIECLEGLINHPELPARQRAVVEAQLAALHLSINKIVLAQPFIESAVAGFSDQYDARHPRVRRLLAMKQALPQE